MGKPFPPTAVQLDDLSQRSGVAVVKVRRGQRDVPEQRDLEGAVEAEALADGRAVEDRPERRLNGKEATAE
jgi:hypothetical protein